MTVALMPKDRLLPLLRGVTDNGIGKWRAYCPIHETAGEHNPSLDIEECPDGKLLLFCQVCRETAPAPKIVYALGLTMSELYPDHGARPQSGGGKKKRKNPARPPGSRKVAEWEYKDADGVVVYKVIRYELPDGSKTFSQARPNGQGGWIPNLRGLTRVLYRLPELIAAPKTDIVFVCEGEKKVEAIRKWGLTATCNVGGAGKWLKEYATYFRGRPVVILPDNDPVDQNTGRRVGLDHAAKIFESLKDVAARVQILELPGLPPKGDIVDWIAAGGTREQFLKLVSDLSKEPSPAPQTEAAGPPVDPLSTHFEERLLERLQIEVLGHIDGRKAKVFSHFHKKSCTVDVDRLTYGMILNICGPVAKQHVCKGNDPVGDIATVSQVKDAIHLLAGYTAIGDETESGPGVWSGVTVDGKPDNSILMIGAGEAIVLNGEPKPIRIQSPKYKGRLIDISTPVQWYTADDICRRIESFDANKAVEIVEEAENLFARWCWKSGPQTPAIVTGLVLASWVQTLWDWRPQVAIIGQSNSGKTTLFRALGGEDSYVGIFGRLVIKSGGSTAAGIRQKIQHSAAIVLCDEFDSGKHRQDILDMLRNSSRGEATFRGTTHGKRANEFRLQHLVWIAGTDSGIVEEPDRNRFITLDLAIPPEEQMGKLEIPTPEVLSDLGQNLLAISVKTFRRAKEIAKFLNQNRPRGFHTRVVESYAVPAAAYAAASGMTDDQAMECLERMLGTHDASEIQGDDKALLGDILDSSLDLGHGRKASVSQVIEWRDSEFDATTTLEKSGIGIVDKGGVTFIFIAHMAVLRHLLKGTRWEGRSIQQILVRIPGATKGRERIGGRRPEGTYVPLSFIQEAI